MLSLCGNRRDVSLTQRGLFLGRWASGDSAGASVIAHIVHGDIIHNDRFVVHVSNVGHAVHGAVVEEGPVVPISSLIADAYIAETVIDTAIESDARPPVALIKDKEAI